MSENCGSFGCMLPADHNRGRADIPENHHRGHCRPGSHYFPPFKESSDLGGGAQTCECGKVLIDRTLGGGRKVEFGDGVLRGR